jgi:hypothetical protein
MGFNLGKAVRGIGKRLGGAAKGAIGGTIGGLGGAVGILGSASARVAKKKSSAPAAPAPEPWKAPPLKPTFQYQNRPNQGIPARPARALNEGLIKRGRMAGQMQAPAPRPAPVSMEQQLRAAQAAQAAPTAPLPRTVKTVAGSFNNNSGGTPPAAWANSLGTQKTGRSYADVVNAGGGGFGAGIPGNSRPTQHTLGNNFGFDPNAPRRTLI